MTGAGWAIIGTAAIFSAVALLKPNQASADVGGGSDSGNNSGSDSSGGSIISQVFDMATGQKLSASQIADYAAAAGFSGDDLPVATAIALAESRGNPNAYNPETAAGTPEGQGSYGLWQIYRKAHPEFNGVDLTDPQQNAIAAYSVYANAGNSFKPWSTFNTYDSKGKRISVGTGPYLANLDTAQAAVSA